MSDSAAPRLGVSTTLLRRWKTLSVFVVLGTAAGVCYGLLAPAWYQARLTVVPAQQNRESLTTSLTAKLPIGLDSPTDAQRIQAVLQSVSVADQVIEKFELEKRYRVTHREHARNALREHCATGIERKANVVWLTCEDREPAKAMAITSYFGEVGNRVFERISASSAREERSFLEAQVTQARAAVDAASQKLRDFQERYKIVDLPEQSKAVISAMATIQGELISKQLELSYLTSFSSAREPSVVQLQQQIGIMRAKLAKLQDTRDIPPASGSAASGSAASGEFFPAAMTVPARRFELEQLVREQKIQETVFFLLTQRYELARIDEARDTSMFQVLDEPTLPTVRSRPKRKKLVVTGCLLGGVAGALWILAPVWWRRQSRAA
jgi:tyrosine-protein kinase Etk/Wzc